MITGTDFVNFSKPNKIQNKFFLYLSLSRLIRVHDKFHILRLNPSSGVSKKFFYWLPGLGVNQEKEFFGFWEFCRTPIDSFTHVTSNFIAILNKPKKL